MIVAGVLLLPLRRHLRGSAVMVIAARNPVHSVLFLILAFFNAAGLFVLLGAEFLAMILVVVYVGAVAVLFLFVVMMLDIDFAELKQGVAAISADRRADRRHFPRRAAARRWRLGARARTRRRRSTRADSADQSDLQHRGARPHPLHALCLLLPGRRHDPAGRHGRRHRADAAAPRAACAARTSASRSRARRRRRSRFVKVRPGQGLGSTP